jgi:hypothetical protein
MSQEYDFIDLTTADIASDCNVALFNGCKYEHPCGNGHDF